MWQPEHLTAHISQLLSQLTKTETLARPAATFLAQLPAGYRDSAAAQTAAIAISDTSMELRRTAAHLTLELDGIHSPSWAASSDPMLRVFAIERFYLNPDPEQLLVDALSSEDALIRSAAAFELTFNSAVTPAVSAALRHALLMPDAGTCGHCGTTYSGNGFDCGACHRRLPDPRTLIARLVGVSLLPDDEEPMEEDWI